MNPESNLEREVKLEADLQFELPDLTGVLPGVAAYALPDARLEAIYLDTDDLRMMRWGVTLRHRHDTAVGLDVGGDSASGGGSDGAPGEMGWTLKLPEAADGVAIVRTELSWPGKFGHLPGEIARMVQAIVRRAPIGPVAQLVTERRRIELRDASGLRLAELDDDEVSVMEHRSRTSRFRQVEIEATDDAPPGLLEEVVRRLVAVGARPGDDRPKVVRALGPRAEQGPDVVIPELGARSTVADAVSASIAGGLTRLIRHDPGVRLGDDPEHVHQARVGTRRLRSDLRTFEPLLDPARSGAIRDQLGRLASALGEVRDADVLTARLRSQIRSLPDGDANAAAGLIRQLVLQRDEARSRLLAVLDEPGYVTLLEELAQAAANPPLVPAGVPTPVSAEVDVTAVTAADGSVVAAGVTATPSACRAAAEVLPGLVRKPWKRLGKAVKALGDDAAVEALHEVRIKAKRVRYASEAAAPVIGKPARQLASAVAELQGVLGELQDAVVAEAWLRRYGESAALPGEAMVAGELVALQRRQQAECRQAWSDPWAEASRKRLRAWLKG